VASSPACCLWTIPMTHPTIVLITGERQTGKSTACRRAVALMRRAGLTVSGLVTERTGEHDLSVRELHTGEVYALTLPFDDRVSRPLMNFRMDPQAMARSLASLGRGFPTEVVVIDELGPLELKRGKGWVEALDYLRGDEYRVGILVIRPELLGIGILALPRDIYTVVRVTPENRDRVPAIVAEAAVAACVWERAGEEKRRYE
jgi:nucleoside-triphosphatase